MKKLAYIIFYISLFTFSQKIENLLAEAQGNKIVITHDILLGQPNNTYTIFRYSSHNNFNAPVRRVKAEIMYLLKYRYLW